VTTTQAPAEPSGTQRPPAARPAGQDSQDGQAPRPAGVPGQAAEPTTLGLPQLVRLLGTIVAPTTLLASLLFYFGWSHAFRFYDYFGVSSTLLGLTTQDYLMRALDGLFVPMTAVAFAGLLALWGHTALRARLAIGSRTRELRLLLPLLAIVGIVLAAGGVLSVFTPTVLSGRLAAAPVSLAVGVLLLAYVINLRRYLSAGPHGAVRSAGPGWAAVAEWGAVFVLVGLSLFWAAYDYSDAVGRGRARQFVAELPTYPSAVIYSERSLSLAAPGVREVRCRDPQAAHRFRYDGLKLVPQSGDQYLLLPEAWTPSNGVAILMPRSDTVRLEFIPASARGTVPRSTC
jgi:hypothetical protein